MNSLDKDNLGGFVNDDPQYLADIARIDAIIAKGIVTQITK